MTSLQERLFAMQDKQYAAFQAKLTPGVPVESFIGIRVPVLRKFAKEFTKEAECKEFLHQLPHQYYDENMLHGLLISEVKDYEECIRLTEKFLQFVDNWAVCDIMSPKVFSKHKKELLAKIKTWSKSSHVYTCRFGIEALMSHYLDKDFKAEYLEIPASVRSEEYYVKMMVAWFFSTSFDSPEMSMLSAGIVITLLFSARLSSPSVLPATLIVSGTVLTEPTSYPSAGVPT